jgi:hypothetical protein
VLVLVVVFMFCYVPETKGLSLEEVRVIFDGQQQVDSLELQAAAARDNETDLSR